MMEYGDRPGANTHRITVDVDEALYRKAKMFCLDKGLTLRTLFLKGLTNVIEPPIRFCAPHLPARVPLDEFLRDSREIAVCGVTLSSVHDDYADFFKKKVQDGATLSFVLLNPEIDPNHSVLRVIQDRHDPKFEGGVLEELKRSVDFLMSLASKAEAHNAKVRILLVQQLPMCGITIADPLTERSKMRVSLYLHNTATDFDPFFEISRQAFGGVVYDAFYKHYQALCQDASLLKIGES